MRKRARKRIPNDTITSARSNAHTNVNTKPHAKPMRIRMPRNNHTTANANARPHQQRIRLPTRIQMRKQSRMRMRTTITNVKTNPNAKLYSQKRRAPDSRLSLSIPQKMQHGSPGERIPAPNRNFAPPASFSPDQKSMDCAGPLRSMQKVSNACKSYLYLSPTMRGHGCWNPPRCRRMWLPAPAFMTTSFRFRILAVAWSCRCQEDYRRPRALGFPTPTLRG